MSRPLHIEVTDLAQAQIRAAENWWRLNRPKAPNAIREELERASSLYLGADDRQFVTVVSTGGGLTGSQVTNDEIVAFALPKNDARTSRHRRSYLQV